MDVFDRLLVFTAAQILKVEEPAKCNYRITVHVLALCQLPEFMPQ